MREIKFRAWHAKEKRWIHDSEHACNILGETIVLGEWMSGVRIKDFNDIHIEQFTGLKDKNGKEIYEGDILKLEVWDSYKTKKIKDVYGAVFFDDGRFQASNLGGISLSACEVIGNIRENPELLKV